MQDFQDAGWELGIYGDKHTTEVSDTAAALGKMNTWAVSSISWGCSMPNSRIEKEKLDDSEFILQQYILKKLDLLIYGCRMRDGQTAIAGAMLRDRWEDSGSSSHGYLASNVPPCAEANKIITYLEKIDFYGHFNFECGMVEDKTDFQSKGEAS